jgi:hypothetical protein
LFLKKLGLFLTISFALCTILANHAMASWLDSWFY